MSAADADARREREEGEDFDEESTVGGAAIVGDGGRGTGLNTWITSSVSRLHPLKFRYCKLVSSEKACCA